MTRLLAALALSLSFAAPAAAENPTRSNLPDDLDGTVTTTNVMVHYRTTGDGAVTQQAAADAAAATEASIARYSELGFPRPLDDGDGHVDVYYYAYGPANQHGLATPDKGTATSSGYIRLNPLYDQPLQTVKHELFHLVQFAISNRYREVWFSEATASWARWQVDDPPAENFEYFNDYAAPINCTAKSDGPCSDALKGYHTWLFFSEFDAKFVRDVLDGIAAAGAVDKVQHGYDVILSELAKRNLTLEGVLTDLGTKMVQATLPYANSRGRLPATELALAPPATPVASAPTMALVQHSALQFVALEPSGACATVPLALDVQGPAGVAAVRFVQRGGASQPLALGTTTVVPWIACADNPAYAMLANGTASADDQAFTITGQVVTPALTKLTAPARTTRKRKRAFKVPVSVTASAAGSLRVKLAGVAPAVRPLAAGANAFSIKVPKSFKRAKAGLTLTPSVGGYTGLAAKKTLRFKTRKQ